MVNNNSSITAGNNITINTGGNTNLTGAVIANKTTNGSDGGNLSLTTNSFTYSDIHDKDKARSFGFGVGVGNNPKTNANQSGNFNFNYSSHDIEQITRATIGSGTINITNEANQTQDLANLNRDMDLAQEITKDTITGALDVSVTIDNRLIAAAVGNDAARRSLNETIGNGPGNLLVIAIAASAGLKDVITSFTDIDSQDPKNDNYFEVLENKTQLRTDALFNTQGYQN